MKCNQPVLLNRPSSIKGSKKKKTNTKTEIRNTTLLYRQQENIVYRESREISRNSLQLFKTIFQWVLLFLVINYQGAATYHTEGVFMLVGCIAVVMRLSVVG